MTMKEGLCKALWAVLAGVALAASVTNGTAQIQVTSANPNNAPQGTVNLNVTVNGNGFKKGAKAQWFISGSTNPGGVTVNSTAFNSAGQVTANITVAADAYVGGFDVVVTNTDGRSGKGTELFAVNSNGAAKVSCTAPVPINPVVNSCFSSVPESSCIDSYFGSAGEVTYLDIGLAPQGEVRLQPPPTSPAGGTPKIIVFNQTGSSATVLRFNLDGTLDSTFGRNGVVNYPLEPSGTLIGVYDGLIDANRNILVGGYAGSNIFVMRLLPDGAVDTSFGSNGVFTSPGSLSGSAEGQALAIQPDGKVLAVGAQWGRKGSSGSSLILRLTSTGALDPTFGSGGFVSFTSGTSGQALKAVAIQTLGTTSYIVAGGGNWLGRFTPSGALDPSFGSGGQAIGPTCGGTGYARSIYVDGSGNVFMLGYSNAGTSSGPYLNLTKYTSAGVLDTKSFGDVSGTARTGSTFLNVFGGSSYPGWGASLILTTNPTGTTQLVATGYGSTPGSPSYTYSILARYNLDGTIDPTFGGGVVARGFGSGAAWGMGAVSEPNGEIIPFIVWNNAGGYLALTRYWP
jgi:uncharacterized delta-60 repeat protein